ncbi:oligopeptide ABC transporter permease [Alicyclobacillus dauci]|uniref:ABC transporter permease n=1 Tax=Alicyclobacillus dauci TaxID=1475485 RepID=A0ABY6Z668_9BACL|nr:oligopeptide ABC transporter permease [Alicyclobacillus dauci]WAH38107.1 ABC transporter permease [Alicyclobacillus dauci]
MSMEPAQVLSPKGTTSSGRVSKSPLQLAFGRFMHNRMAVASVVVLVIIVLMSLLAPLLTHWNPQIQDLANVSAPPSAKHLLGTDNNGTDLFARDLYGGRIDLLIGFIDMIMVMGIAIILGGLAGYYGGWVDSVIMRICDFMFNFPFLLLVIVLESIINTTSVWLLILVIGLTGWPGTTRLIRSLFLSIRESEYVLASKIGGAGSWRIIIRHLLPASLGPIVVNATLQMAGLIGAEAALAVIGFGVSPKIPSWGNVLNASLDYFTLSTEPWAWIPPALLITVTILCINFIGDGLRDAFDPSFEK